MGFIAVLVLINFSGFSQIPFYYKFKKIEGVVYTKDGDEVLVQINSRNKLTITNCNDEKLETFLRTLMLGRHGRKELEHLLKTEAKVTIIIHDKAGAYWYNGQCMLVGGISGPAGEVGDLIELVDDYDGYKVYKENTIEIFEKSIAYANDTNLVLTEGDIKIMDRETGTWIEDFSLDTMEVIKIQDTSMLYKNLRELYYFCGLHEIYHTRSENIVLNHIEGGDPEADAWALEEKAFKHRKAINRRKIKVKREKRFN